MQRLLPKRKDISMYMYMLIFTKKVLTVKIGQVQVNDVTNITGISDRVTLYERIMNDPNHVN